MQTLDAYITCALWSSTDGSKPLDATYTADDLAPETVAAMRADVDSFLERCEGVDELTPEQLGHDFWLTRNHHGAGFWDRDLGDLGDTLTAIAHSYGESDLYIGDDGSKLYVSPVPQSPAR